jgi:hypothetical protein
MRISPSDLEVLIHCHADPRPHPRLYAPAVEEALVRFQQQGIIVPKQDPKTTSPLDMEYRTTDLGKAWLELILQTPIPRKEEKTVYIDPRTDRPIEDDRTIIDLRWSPMGRTSRVIEPGFYRPRKSVNSL